MASLSLRIRHADDSGPEADGWGDDPLSAGSEAAKLDAASFMTISSPVMGLPLDEQDGP